MPLKSYTIERLITREEAMEKYGEVPLHFESYYKYSFGFQGIAPDGALIYISVGGNVDDIYRFKVKKDTVITLKTAEAEYVKITDAEQTICTWNTW